ncbi:hypothetical protein vseg_014242 [Gypsophila vaccaria]
MVLWVYFYTFLFTLFGFIGQHIFRLQGKLMGINSNIQEQNERCTPEFVVEECGEEESESLLRFRFRTFEEFVQNNDVYFNGGQVLYDNSDDNCSPVENTRDMLISRNDMVSKYVDEKLEPGISSEFSMIVKYVKEVAGPRISSENLSESIGKYVEEFVDPRVSSEMLKIENSRRDLRSVHVHGVEEKSDEIEIENRGEPSQIDDDIGDNAPNVRLGTDFLSDNESLVSDSDLDSVVSSNSSFRGSFIDSLSDGFLSDIDFQRTFEIDTLMEYCCKEVNLSNKISAKDVGLENLSKVNASDYVDDEDKLILQELKEIEYELDDNFISFGTGDRTIMETESQSEQSSENRKLESNLVSVSNTSGMEDELSMVNELLGVEYQNFELNFVPDFVLETKMDNNGLESKQNSEKSSSEEQLSSDSEEQNGLEREWEHQDLVEQLKMEIKNVRAIGLPTILEESESPKIMDDLKPWKIEQKYHHEGTMDELHKFYKSYRERMRKLDILNFQKMYAIGFLRLKDPLQSFTKNRISIPALSTIMLFSCWPCKPKLSAEIHKPLMEKFSKELESDLETVYVGQMCLSWEFLCWEYSKALEIWESDPHGMRCYNEVAEKFQMFQVLLTRFLEEEKFEGPRVQHYVKIRCVHRNLLQVPVVRDDNYMDRKKPRKVISSKDAITSLQLVEIIEESIRILWQFIRTDKNSSKASLGKFRRSSNVELRSPTDASLLSEVQSILQEKHKKLKELTRTQNCLLRSIHRQEKDDNSDNVLYFFTRVDIKLVSRVLNMPKVSTEQLVWCSHKLNRINFVGRKLQVVEPSILLFPSS